ncbi:MAG TPA: DUF2336 domain-containing protein [Alphaproteobacteria bacterium]|nr:DUF2336 domain-containing protein [Alphaproteobacteria bacterium]
MLTKTDIERVRTGGMSAEIAPTADKLAAVYRHSAENSEKRKLAEDIIAIWLARAATEVREALARQLAHCPFLPRELALEMARDLDTVATPMLRYSQAFTDEDLSEIARSPDPVRQIAVAMRREVSYVVAEALLASRNETVVTALVKNDGARLSERLLHRIVDGYLDSVPVHDGLVGRADLPVSIGERLVTLVSDQLREHLVTRFEMPRELLEGLGELSREAATSALLPASASAQTARRFADHLNDIGRLSPTFLLRTLCDGKVGVFIAGLASRTRMRAEHVGEILRTGYPEQQADLYLRAGIPELLIPALRAGVDVIVNGRVTSEDTVVSDDQIGELIGRIVQQYDFIDPMDLDTVLMRLFQAIRDSEKGDRRRPEAARTVPRLGTADLHISARPDASRPDRRRPARLRMPAEAKPCSMKLGHGNTMIIKQKCENGPH